MTKHLSRADLRASTVDIETALYAAVEAAIAPRAGRHGEPFAKRDEGRQRRAARKSKIARRWAWME